MEGINARLWNTPIVTKTGKLIALTKSSSIKHLSHGDTFSVSSGMFRVKRVFRNKIIAIKVKENDGNT